MKRINRNLLLFSLILIACTAWSQEENSTVNKETQTVNDTIQTPGVFVKDQTYELGGINIIGLQKFEEETVRVFTGLRVGQEIKLPGDKLTSAIKKLYETDQFSQIDIYIAKMDGRIV